MVRTMLSWSYLMSLVQVLSLAASQPIRAADPPDLATVEKQIFVATNEFRRQEDCRELTANAKLAEAAAYFARFLARTDKFSHTADGKEPWERATAHGYVYCIVLENIAYQASSTGFTAEELSGGFMKGWKESPGHRKNLLDKDVTEIGVAVAHSKETGKYFAVQLFGRPKSQEIVFKVSNRTGATVRYWVDGKVQSIGPRYTNTHQVCRPPDLAFHWTAPNDKLPEKPDTVLHPASGSQYVIRKDRTGKFTVMKK